MLDDIDINSLFEKTEEERKGFREVLKNPEKRDYVITVTLRNGQEKKISGAYNRKGLPPNWEDFAEAVFDFMSFYGCGEILNPAVYGKDYDDIILCSIRFKEG